MSVLGILAVLFSSSLCLCFLWVVIKSLYKVWWTPFRIKRVMSSQGIGGPPYRIIYGNTKEILRMRSESISKPMDLSSYHLFPRIQPHLHSWVQTYGKNFLTWYGPQPQLIITEPEHAKEILTNKEKTYVKPEMETYAKKLLGEGLATSEGEKWIKLRRLANHAFRAESLKNMVPAMIESVEMMLERWKPHEGQEIEVFGEFRMLTSDVISKTAFGSSYLEGKSIFDKLTQMGAILSRNVYKVRLPIFSKLWKNGDDIQSDHIERGIIDSFIEMVKKREKLKAETGSYGNDLLGLLVMANNDADENNRITVKEVVDECRIFYFAGHETTINLLGWATLLLAVHTDWQEKAREEVLALFAQQNPNPEGLARMKVVTMILNETLRLFPPAFNLTRKVQNEVRLGELLLPANIHVFIPILSLHCNPQIWGEDANLFKPERFSEGVAKATNNNLAAFIPFGLGPRSCVGNNFAMNEAKIALSMILQRYAFTLSPTYVHSPAHILTVNPRYGLQIRLHPL